MNEIASPVVKNFAQIVSGNLTEAIESTTQDNWHETLAMILMSIYMVIILRY